MSRFFPMCAACGVLAVLPVFCFAAITTDSDFAVTATAAVPSSLTKALPVLVAAISSGSENACTPTHLTLTGQANHGSRLYVSAGVSQFATELRKSAKGHAKLTSEQSHEIQRLVDAASQAQKTGTGLTPEFLDQIATNTGMSVKATVICLSLGQMTSRLTP